MKLLKCALVLVALALAAAVPVFAQPTAVPKPRARVSPHETISNVIDGNRVTIVYGRPYTKDPKSGEARKIWGGLVPFGKVWRTGSDEATMLVTEKALVIGGTTVPAGAYTIFTLPTETGASKLIINKQIGQWGETYDEKQDLARIDMKKDAPEAAVDQFTMSVDKDAASGGFVRMLWENSQFSVPFTVKK